MELIIISVIFLLGIIPYILILLSFWERKEGMNFVLCLFLFMIVPFVIGTLVIIFLPFIFLYYIISEFIEVEIMKKDKMSIEETIAFYNEKNINKRLENGY